MRRPRAISNPPKIPSASAKDDGGATPSSLTGLHLVSATLPVPECPPAGAAVFLTRIHPDGPYRHHPLTDRHRHSHRPGDHKTVESKMFRIIYFSGATSQFSPEAIIQLAARANDKNSRLGVTGLLLYCHGNFLQVIEGEETVLRELYEVIREDPRHRRVVTVVEETITERDFGNWGMAVRNLDLDPDLPEGIHKEVFLEWDAVGESIQSASVKNIVRIFSEATFGN